MTIGREYQFCRVVKGGLIVHLIPKVAHSTLADLIADKVVKFAYPEEVHEGYRFMVVRHPLDRIVSAFNFFTKRDKIHEHMKNLGYSVGMSWEQWLKILRTEYNKNVHTDKQILFSGGQIIDELCPIERLDDAWPIVARRFGLPPIKHLNSTKHETWSTYYTGEQREEFESVFSEDVELYKQALTWRK